MQRPKYAVDIEAYLRGRSVREFGGCGMTTSFFLFQPQFGNFSLAIQDNAQEQKMLAYFGTI
jgi:hypothetical protein